MSGHPTHATVRLPSGRIVSARIIDRAPDGELTVIWGGMFPFKAFPLSVEELRQTEEAGDA